jgi:hypothetical protein
MFVNWYSAIAVGKRVRPSGVTGMEEFRRKTAQKLTVTFKNVD